MMVTLLLIILCLSLVLIAIEISGLKKLSLVYILRILWILLCLGVAYDYKVSLESKLSNPVPVRFFVDRSDSVSESVSRKSRIIETAERVSKWAKSENIPFEVYSFSDSLLTGPIKHWGGSKTLISSIEATSQPGRSRRLVLSDGLFMDQPRIEDGLTYISVQSDDDRDIWIEGVLPAYTAYLKNRFEFSLSVRQKGFRGASTKVGLYRGFDLIAEKKITLGDRETSVSFQFFPEKMGDEILFVRVTPLDGELSGLNNFQPIMIKVVRDKIRILHVSGRPSMDLKAWRLFLTRQPDVDLVSFYILRSLEDNPEARDYELSLIPFPYEDLFTTELEKFDVIILQNFDFNLYFQPFYLANLARFIERGGSLLMMGGELGYHNYFASPLESHFPFRFGNSRAALTEGNFKVSLFKDHPITRGLSEVFDRMRWSIYHKVLSGSDSLDLLKFDSGVPFLSLKEVDKGRVVAINSDESWKLQFSPEDGGRSFNRLARRILQYLTFDPDMELESIDSDDWIVGSTIKLKSRAGSKTRWKIRSLLVERPFEMNFDSQTSIQFKVPFAGLFEVEALDLSRRKIFSTKEKPWRDEWKNLFDSPLKVLVNEKRDGLSVISYRNLDQIKRPEFLGRETLVSKTLSWMERFPPLSLIVMLFILAVIGLDFWLRKKAELDT